MTGDDDGRGSPEPERSTPTDRRSHGSIDGHRSRLDELLAALADSRRRNIVYYLRDAEQITIETLSRQVASWEHDTPASETTPEMRENALLDLTHAHLPALSEAGLVEYDRRSGAIRFRDPPAMLRPLLDTFRTIEKSDRD